MRTRWPWGEGRAPALRCDECRRTIGRARAHIIVDQHLLCARCVERRDLHAKYFPDCHSADRHDLTDHPHIFASRAAAWLALPDPQARTA